MSEPPDAFTAAPSRIEKSHLEETPKVARTSTEIGPIVCATPILPLNFLQASYISIYQRFMRRALRRNKTRKLIQGEAITRVPVGENERNSSIF